VTSPPFCVLNDHDNFEALIAQMPSGERGLFNKFRALTIQAAFDDRIFIVYQPGSKGAPKILALLKCLGFKCNSHGGASVTLEDQSSGRAVDIGYTPVRPFGLDVFMSLPLSLQLRWDAKEGPGGLRRSFSYALLIKMQSKADRYPEGSVCCVTPNDFRRLFPNSAPQMKG